MSAQVIDFAEARERRRSGRALEASDWLVFAAVCFWPVSLSLCIGLSALETVSSLVGGRGRA